MAKTEYTITVDPRRAVCEFHAAGILKAAGGSCPSEIAAVYRMAAAHLLGQAAAFDTLGEFMPRDPWGRESIEAQAARLLACLPDDPEEVARNV